MRVVPPARLPRCLRFPDSAPYPLRGRRHFDMFDAVRRERIDDGIDDSRQRADRSRFARALHTEWIVRRQHFVRLADEDRK